MRLLYYYFHSIFISKNFMIKFMIKFVIYRERKELGLYRCVWYISLGSSISILWTNSMPFDSASLSLSLLQRQWCNTQMFLCHGVVNVAPLAQSPGVLNFQLRLSYVKPRARVRGSFFPLSLFFSTPAVYLLCHTCVIVSRNTSVSRRKFGREVRDKYRATSN